MLDYLSKNEQNSRIYEVEHNGQNLHQRIEWMTAKGLETSFFQIEYKLRSEMSIFFLLQ